MLNDFWDSIVGVFNTITWSDIVDVAFVSFLIYQAIKLVRESRAIQLVKGILLLLALYFVATQLQLRTMSFIMQNVLQVGVIALLVVFQPELRRALEQIGRTKITNLGVFNSQDSEEQMLARWKKTIEAICEGAMSLSKQKIGALIVIERETRLGEIIKTGTIIDSDPSMELIGSIFFPNSPLHDGAMIIRGGKLYAAGCYLPLSGNYEISRDLGTRHRAALGMSEVSDAVIVVVSEETGVITVCINGHLTRNYNAESLAQKLRVEILKEKPEEQSGKRSGFWKVKR